MRGRSQKHRWKGPSEVSGPGDGSLAASSLLGAVAAANPPRMGIPHLSGDLSWGCTSLLGKKFSQSGPKMCLQLGIS